jgi:hypothetical protein
MRHSNDRREGDALAWFGESGRAQLNDDHGDHRFG